MVGSSPHTRGAHQRAPVWVRHQGIIPAYAGSTAGRFSSHRDNSDHPRIRGEHVQRHDPKGDFTGSSPHTRGARLPEHREVQGPRIIPAYAGSTHWRHHAMSGAVDHPRIRGEHVEVAALPVAVEGSSPHTRGAHLEIPAIPRIAAVIIPVFLYPSPTPQEEADRSMVLLTLS